LKTQSHHQIDLEQLEYFKGEAFKIKTTGGKAGDSFFDSVHLLLI